MKWSNKQSKNGVRRKLTTNRESQNRTGGWGSEKKIYIYMACDVICYFMR